VLQFLQYHPGKHQYRFEHSYGTLHWVGRVSKIESDLAQQRVEPIVMLAAERNSEPRDVIPTDCMVPFDPFSAATDCALTKPFSFVHDGLAIVR
jgi:hypothetical protein